MQLFDQWRRVSGLADGRPSLEEALKYLEMLAGSGAPRTKPGSFAAALAMFESASGDGPGEKVSASKHFGNALKSVVAELTAEGTEVKKALPYPMALIMALELAVLEEESSWEKFDRYIAWTMLVRAWGALRCADFQAIKPADVTATPAGLRIRLTKTKTSGPDKKVITLYAYVAEGVFLIKKDWMKVGYQLMLDPEVVGSRGFMLPVPSAAGVGGGYRSAKYAAVAAMSRRVLRALRAPTLMEGEWKAGPEWLLNLGMDMLWSEHSPRHVTTNFATVMGLSVEDQDMAGRWGAARLHHGSADYRLSSRIAVARLQRSICDGVRQSRFGVDEVDIKMAVLQAGFTEADWLPFEVTVDRSKGEVGGVSPQLGAEADPSFDLDEVGAEVEDVAVFNAEPKTRPTTAFWLGIGKNSGFRRLHRSGACGAWARVGFKEELTELVDGVADARCRLCWPEPSGPTSSPSASSSSSNDE